MKMESPGQSSGLVRPDDAEAVELMETVQTEVRPVLEDAHETSAQRPPPRALDGACRCCRSLSSSVRFP